MRKALNVLVLLSLVLFLSGCYSCQTWNDMWGGGQVNPGAEHKLFFDKDCKPVAKAKPAGKPKLTRKPEPRKITRTICGCAPSDAERSYPCDSCEIIRLGKHMPTEVQLNATFEYSIKVINVSGIVIDEVVVTEVIINNSLDVQNASPSAKKIGNKLIWELGRFQPGETKTITVYAKALDPDCIETCASVTYIIPTCAKVNVVQAKLELVKTAPAEVTICDPIPVKFKISNPGTGSVQNVKIEDILPAGLTTAEGRDRLVIDAGTLTAGQSKQFSAILQAEKPGKYVNRAVATSSSGLKSESQTTTIVRQPVLVITKTGPKKRYIGRPVTYEITVANKGDIAAENLVIEDQLQPGVKFVKASKGAKVSSSSVVWNVASLPAGKAVKVELTVTAQFAGKVKNTVTARAICAGAVKASAQTSVAGIPAILLEVIDIGDPVEIGGTTTYVITATNQGSAPGTNISIVCNLEDNEKYVSSSGATAARVQGNTITFIPLKSLAPKAKAIWRIVVRAETPGDVRFKVTMNTDQINRPVQETEATHLYK